MTGPPRTLIAVVIVLSIATGLVLCTVSLSKGMMVLFTLGVLFTVLNMVMGILYLVLWAKEPKREEEK